MATRKKQKEENVGESVQQTPRATTGRQRQERRIASGNRRRGQIASEMEVNRSAAARKVER